MTLQKQLDSIHKYIVDRVPDLAKVVDLDTEQLVREHTGREAPGVGDLAPDFLLPDQQGKFVRSEDLRSRGPVVINFYRGGWCPYCSLELRTLQRYLPEVYKFNASLVAISAQVPEFSISTVEKNELSFPVLSDVGNQVARSFGLVFTLSEEVRPVYKKLKIDVPKFNGEATFELPIPGTFIVGKDSVVRASFVNADYKKRMEPEYILDILGQLREF